VTLKRYTLESPVRVTDSVFLLRDVVFDSVPRAVKGPGFATVVEAKREEVPLTSTSSTRTVFENARQEV